MSEQHRTATEYKEKYAGSYCDGDTDIAEEHEIVKEVCEELREEWLPISVLDYLIKRNGIDSLRQIL